MPLTYKYSGGKFDTSYKSTATVTKKSLLNYFVMSSYTGVFKNSNTIYSVTTKEKNHFSGTGKTALLYQIILISDD